MNKADKRFNIQKIEENTELRLLKEIKDSIDRLLDAAPHRKYYTIKDIIREYGVSRSTVMASYWLQPNFGISDLPGRTKKWLPETYKAWFRVSPEIHRRQYEKMSREERLKLVM